MGLLKVSLFVISDKTIRRLSFGGKLRYQKINFLTTLALSLFLTIKDSFDLIQFKAGIYVEKALPAAFL